MMLRRQELVDRASGRFEILQGEFTGKNLLYVSGSLEEVASRTGKAREDVEASLHRARTTLFERGAQAGLDVWQVAPSRLESTGLSRAAIRASYRVVAEFDRLEPGCGRAHRIAHRGDCICVLARQVTGSRTRLLPRVAAHVTAMHAVAEPAGAKYRSVAQIGLEGTELATPGDGFRDSEREGVRCQRCVSAHQGHS